MATTVRSRTYNLPPGGTFLIHSSLRRVRILGVARNENVLTIIPGIITPTGNEVSYLGIGRLRTDPNNPYLPNEKMWVLYET